jgi:hypothetical protein
MFLRRATAGRCNHDELMIIHLQVGQCFFYAVVTKLLLKQWMVLPKGMHLSCLL